MAQMYTHKSFQVSSRDLCGINLLDVTVYVKAIMGPTVMLDFADLWRLSHEKVLTYLKRGERV